MRKILILMVAIIITMSCSGKKDETKAQSVNDEVKSITVQTETLKFDTFMEYIELSARPEGITDVAVTSEANGRITAVNKAIGDEVKKGDEIGRIDNKDYEIRLKQSKAALMGAESNLEAVSIELKGAEKLYETKSISDTEMMKKRANYKNAIAALEGAKAAVEQNQKAYDNTRLLSPVSGRITDINIKLGENTISGKAVCTIVDTRKLKIKTGLGEKDISILKKGMQAEITHENLKTPVQGIITGIGVKPYTNTSNYPVEIVFDNPDGKIFPGMVVNCRILSTKIENSIVIRTDNIIKELDNEFVYLADNGIAKKTQIVSGRKYGDRIIVLSGLKQNDRLIVSGTDNLSDGTVIREK
ncbi:MAG: efflux RND transporter periplasmic adaptor subunit [Candidatus Delongbacteria bacterium]|nr:efflux RND transporter periplasmic adaptor subunit [Candidatus Delongbacteria bacterium]MCG2760154.1 efflux RND transporter periplasmic adaptor subunit [Candidatus Delongbacteria bacterium]